MVVTRTNESVEIILDKAAEVGGHSAFDGGKLFTLGIAILIGWIVIMMLCARPQLFRKLVQRYLCCKKAPPEDEVDRSRAGSLLYQRVSLPTSELGRNHLAARPSLFYCVRDGLLYGPIQTAIHISEENSSDLEDSPNKERRKSQVMRLTSAPQPPLSRNLSLPTHSATSL